MRNTNLSRKNLIAAAVGSVLAFGAVGIQAAPQVSKNSAKQEEQTRYIVQFKKSSNKALKAAGKTGLSIAQLQKASNVQNLAKHGTDMILHMDRANAAAVNLNKSQLEALRNNPDVAYVEVDPKRYLIDTVSRTFEGADAIEPMAESAPYGIAMVQADQVSDASTTGIKVCITDTGYEGNHEDLRAYTDSGITGDDNDGLGNDTGNWWEPGHAHGTHVAGTIAGLGGNGKGVVGVNPSGVLDLHNVKIFNNAGTWGYGSDLVKAIEQCQTSGSKIISMSIGGGASSTTEENAFIAANNAGMLHIAAAGNDGNTSLSYPASYDSVMSVAAIDSSKNLASFSQRNAQVEIAAPGVAVTSTVLNNGYATWDGTSMATPHVAGVAALVWSRHSSCTPAEIRTAMTSTAQDLGSAGRDNSYGYGLVQAKAMDDSLASGCTVTPPPPPPPPVGGVLENGVAHTGLAGGAQLNFTMEVPAGATDIKFDMAGGTGDADMYVKFGSAPTTGDYDCRPYKTGNTESCTGTNAGTYHVMINAYSTYSGVSLTGSYTDGSTPPPPGGSYTNGTNVNIIDNATVSSSIDVTGNGDSGSVTVNVDIKHTYVGDLTITLVAPNGSRAVLRDNTGGSANDIVATYTVNAAGVDRNGEWKLEVNDNASRDTGFIDTWTLSF